MQTKTFMYYKLLLSTLFCLMGITGFGISGEASIDKYSGSTNEGVKDSVTIVQEGNKVRVEAKTYSWTWSASDDQFILYDSAKRRIVNGPLQPAILVSTGRNTPTTCSVGSVENINISGNRLTIKYSAVNEGASLIATWRFDEDGLWFDPIEYTGNKGEDVVSLYYFSKSTNNQITPRLECYWLVQPGLSASGAISPVQALPSRVNLDTWLGRGATMDNTRLLQQWGLPVHYFCGMSPSSRVAQPSGLTKLLSDAFCVGLAGLPAGDMRLVASQGKCAPVIDMRSDLWGQTRGVGPWTLGATLYWSIAADYRQAIRGYYRGLVNAKVIKPKINSKEKNEVMARPVFNTWGAQLSMNKPSALLDEAALVKIYEDLRKSGLKATCFIIDDKWESEYGSLEHSKTRFPHFDEFLNRIKSDGVKLGMWAAFLRCENPAAIGLEVSNMLHDLNGKPITKGAKPFYLLDVSQPKVQDVLRAQIRKFMKHYQPDIVKFDFGYELPPMSVSAPENKAWGGERLLNECLNVIVPELRKANPDVVVMYYSLSPLFLDHFDLHSTDDLFLNEEEYSLEANRRLYFSSLLGELGMPGYGSGGYNWLNMADIWFDTEPSGSLGSLGSFVGDQNDSKLEDRDIAKFNGLAAVARKANVFKVEPLYANRFGSNGGRASSWIRYEGGVPVLLALRTERITGGNIEASFKDVVHSNVMVVVASRDAQGIASANSLGIVPFGNGEISIKHDRQIQSVSVIAHCLDGSKLAFPCQIKNGFLYLYLKEKLANGSIVEWLQVEIK